MSEQDPTGAKPEKGGADDRRARLGQALRANLARRKEQARARRERAEKAPESLENEEIHEPRR